MLTLILLLPTAKGTTTTTTTTATATVTATAAAAAATSTTATAIAAATGAAPVTRDSKQRGPQNTQKDWGENAVVAGISKQLSRHYKTLLMMSLKEVRNQLLISHDDGVINDEELLLLYDLNDNLDLQHNSYPSAGLIDELRNLYNKIV